MDAILLEKFKPSNLIIVFQMVNLDSSVRFWLIDFSLTWNGILSLPQGNIACIISKLDIWQFDTLMSHDTISRDICISLYCQLLMYCLANWATFCDCPCHTKLFYLSKEAIFDSIYLHLGHQESRTIYSTENRYWLFRIALGNFLRNRWNSFYCSKFKFNSNTIFFKY